MKDWKEQLKEIHKNGDCCGCYEGDIDDLFPEAHKKLENFIEQIISERDKELLERIKNEVPCCGYCPEIARLILNTK